jgi:hypothetical protein
MSRGRCEGVGFPLGTKTCQYRSIGGLTRTCDMTDLEYIIVEGSKGQEGRGAGGSVEEVGVDAVVALVKRDSDAAVVDPRARLESLGSGDADV